jgi:hypothetical protein
MMGCLVYTGVIAGIALAGGGVFGLMRKVSPKGVIGKVQAPLRPNM